MQKLIISLPLYQVEITGEHETDVIKKAAFWCSLPTRCPICDRPLTLGYRTPQTFEYYELRCTGTDELHSVNLGESKGSHDLYFDPKKQWHTYRPDDHEQRDRRFVPNQLVDGPVSPAVPEPPPPNPATPDRIAAGRNQLLKLIADARKRNLRVGITPADVKDLSPIQLQSEIYRLGQLILNAPTSAN